MTTRIATVSLGLCLAVVVASVALFAGSARATLPPPGGGNICSNYASGTTLVPDAIATTGCYSYEVAFYAYNKDHSTNNGVCTSIGFGYEATIFLGQNQGTTLYDHQWCDDGAWHYYYYNSGTSNVLLSTKAQYYFGNTEYYIYQVHT